MKGERFSSKADKIEPFTRKEAPMSAPVTTAASWQWPADVLEFAAKNQVQAYLDPLLLATRRVFPTEILTKLEVGGEEKDVCACDNRSALAIAG
jgi:hypothetical protein